MADASRARASTRAPQAPAAESEPDASGVTAAGRPAASRRRRIEGWLFVIPAFCFQTIWGWYPLVVAFILSFTNAALLSPLHFVGLESYRRMASDPLAIQSIKVTAIYAALTIVLTFVIPIFVAILLMEMPPRALRWMMTLWFLPVSGITSAILWRYMFNSQYGLLEYVALKLGLGHQPFLNSPSQVLIWLIVPGIILFGPGLIYMGAVQGIPSSYFEAAEIEGAGFWRKIWTISLPRIRPVIVMMLTFAIIGSFQAFEWPQLLTGGGPGSSSTTVVIYIYDILQQLRYADGTALAMFLFIIIMVITIIFRYVVKEDPDRPRRKGLRAWHSSPR